ncbi:MAG: hypothetical protein ACR2IF_04085 [Terriglobales bacterium]
MPRAKLISPCLLLISIALSLQAQSPQPAPVQTNSVAAPAADAAPHPVKAKLREELVAEATAGAEVSNARSSDNHIYWVEKANGKRTARLDGKQVGAAYDEIAQLRLSTDEQHLVFMGKNDGRWKLVMDGEERSSPYGRVTWPYLSPDAKSFAFGGCQEKRCRVVINGDDTGPEYEDISWPFFTKNGEHYAYFGKRNKKWIMLLDGKEYGPEMDNYLKWYFVPDGERVAVAGLLNGKWTWIVGGKPGPGFDVISDINFTGDGKHYAYGGTEAKFGMGHKKTLGHIVVDGQVAEKYEGAGMEGGWTLFFGTHTYIVSGLRALWPDFHGVSEPSYTAEGTLVYAARRAKDDVVVLVNGQAGPPFEDIVSPVLVTGDGKHVAYVGKRGDSFVEVRDQKCGASFPGRRVVSRVEQITMSADGAHAAYEIVRGGSQFQSGGTTRALRRIVIDGQGGPEFDALDISGLRLSGGARHHAYIVHGAEGKRDRTVLDGKEGKLYDNVFRYSTKFIDDQTVEYVAQQGQQFLRVTATLD